MLSVKVQFENNLYTKMLLETRDNPCLCKIYENFEIIFFESIPEMTGIVNEWNIKDIDGQFQQVLAENIYIINMV